MIPKRVQGIAALVMAFMLLAACTTTPTKSIPRATPQVNGTKVFLGGTLLFEAKGIDAAGTPDWVELSFSPNQDFFLVLDHGRWETEEVTHAYLFRSDGSGGASISPGCYVDSLSWSPDGQWLAFDQWSGGTLDCPDTGVVRYHLATGKTQVFSTDTPVEGPIWSSDSTWLAFASGDFGEDAIFHPTQVNLLKSDYSQLVIADEFERMNTTVRLYWKDTGSTYLMLLCLSRSVSPTDATEMVRCYPVDRGVQPAGRIVSLSH